MIGRLRNYSDDVWRFMTQPNVPFTTNLAEQTVRMPKVKQKVSAAFGYRKVPGTYCVITLLLRHHAQAGNNIFESLVAAFKGAPPQPSFA
ncbi:MAG: transposase [Comamonadaceae bacterium]|nr:transposase [Comamonadaceae bacterium]